MAVKNMKFVTLLKRDNKKIRADRALRIGKKVANAQSKMIMAIEDDISNAEDRIEAMMDLSADNKSTSMNIVSPNFSGEEFVQEFQTLNVKLKLNKEKLAIAQATLEEWFQA